MKFLLVLAFLFSSCVCPDGVHPKFKRGDIVYKKLRTKDTVMIVGQPYCECDSMPSYTVKDRSSNTADFAEFELEAVGQ
jgi:hypothetical protein